MNNFHHFYWLLIDTDKTQIGPNLDYRLYLCVVFEICYRI